MIAIHSNEGRASQQILLSSLLCKPEKQIQRGLVRLNEQPDHIMQRELEHRFDMPGRDFPKLLDGFRKLLPGMSDFRGIRIQPLLLR